MASRLLGCRASVVLLSVVIGCGGGAGADEGGPLGAGSDDASTPVETGAAIDGGAADAGPCGACTDGVCSPASGACVECLAAGDCEADRPFCVENTCVKCAAGDTGCDEAPSDPDPPDDDPTAPPPPPKPAPFEIRFASYNVRTSNLNNAAWGDHHVGWDGDDGERMRRVADTIASQNLTVVAAQEMRRPERDAVLARLQSHHGQAWGFTTQKQGADDTVVLFRKSVWSKVRETHFVVPMQSGLQPRNQIGTLLQHKATGREIWVYSVHYAAGGDAVAKKAREEGAKRTLDSIQARAVASGHAFVLGGDFNATSDGAVGDVFRGSGVMKYARSAADLKVNDGCKTFNGRAGSEGLQSCPGGAAAHIDQVWVAKAGVQVTKHQVTANARTSRASDHNPLTTILKRL